jgi:dTDP-4-dehydrorhamnose 3,5-epimerase
MSRFSVTSLSLQQVLLVRGRKFSDCRGYLSETYRREDFVGLGITAEFVQDNLSHSLRRGTVRALHFQKPPRSQAKLIRVLRGAIFDVAVDIRRGSPTFGHWCGATLEPDKDEQLFVPRGFAHGFCSLEEDTQVAYKVDDYYAAGSEGGIIWNDPLIAIEWPIKPDEVVLSRKDAALPPFVECDIPFVLKAGNE